MKKMNKLFAAAMTMALAVPMFAVSVSAAGTDSDTTNVSYDNTAGIPDTDNPTNPQWAVQIPSAVHFTDDVTSVDVDVTLVSINNGALPTNNVTVEVASANAYELKMTGGADPVAYEVTYAGITMDDTTAATNEQIGVLNALATTIAGTADLTGTGTVAGVHTDVLTYTISTN